MLPIKRQELGCFQPEVGGKLLVLGCHFYACSESAFGCSETNLCDFIFNRENNYHGIRQFKYYSRKLL